MCSLTTIDLPLYSISSKWAENHYSFSSWKTHTQEPRDREFKYRCLLNLFVSVELVLPYLKETYP